MSRPQVESIHPLSPLQQGLLFHTLQAPEAGLYLDQMVQGIAGELALRALAGAWGHVVSRHAALRTSYHWEKLDQPLQVTHRQASAPFAVVDLSGIDPKRHEALLEDLLEQERRRTFDLSQAPAARLLVIRNAAALSTLVWTFHHIALDGWSFTVLKRDLLGAYLALAAGQRPAAPPARGFGDYLRWLGKQEPGAARAFWHRQLEGFDTPTPLAPAEARGHGQGRREIGRALRVLSAELSGRLRAFAAAHRLTLPTVLSGAFGLVLARQTGEDDVVFGQVAAGRPADLPEADSIVGLFINTLPVRVRIDGTAPPAWLAALQRTQAEAQLHGHLPLSDIQRESGVPRELPLFDAILVFENVSRAAGTLEAGPLRATESRYVSRTHYPLSLVVEPDEEIEVYATFDTARFGEAETEALLTRLETALAGLVEGADAVAEIDLLSPTERRQLAEWAGGAAAPVPEGGPLLHRAVAARADLAPTAPAIEADGEVLSYGELFEQARALAGRLRLQGAGPEVPVAVAAGRTPRAVVAFLAVLEAGAPFLSLDPAAPAERREALLADSGCRLLLTEGADGAVALTPVPSPETGEGDSGRTIPAGSSPLLGPPASCRPLADVPAGSRHSQQGAFSILESRGASPSPVSGEGDRGGEGLPAYVLYTSGTTGRPKGVVVPHGVASRHFSTAAAAFGLAPGTRVLQFTPFGFDAALEQVFATLLAGGTLVLRGEEVWEVESLAGRLAASRVEVANFPTSYWERWARHLAANGGGPPAALRLVIAGGEALSAEAARLWLAGPLGAVPLWNAYGPTEGIVTAAVHPVEGVEPCDPLPLGRPLAGRTLHVLSRAGDLLPPGAAGELCLGGDLLARGYLGRPAETAARFVPDPFSAAPGGRLYRTGDRARFGPGGRVEMLGRLDRQVKVRGVRIEPAEVEAVLARHPGVAEAAVILAGERAEPRLAAFAAAHPGAALTPAELREHARRFLPPAAVPADITLLPALPRTPGGKIDRRALLSALPEAGERGTGPSQAPRTPVEALLASLWAAVLKVERVGIHDDFLELGGHSLAATLLLSRVRDAFGTAPPLAELFAAPTVARQAERVEAALKAGAAEAAPPPLVSGGPAGSYPLSFAQQRLWILDRLDPGTPAYDIPLALRLEGPLEPPRLAAALGLLANRHATLRTRFALEDGRPVQAVEPPATSGRWALPRVDLRGLPEAVREQEFPKLLAAEARWRFDLGQAPLLRSVLFQVGDAAWGVSLNVHHVAADGWSLGILWRELAAFYEAGDAALLPPLPVQYADYAAWQRSWLQGEVLERQLAFWRENLAGLPPVLALPTDRPRPPIQTWNGAHLGLDLDPATAAALARLCRAERATPFMALLAALAELLRRLTGAAEIPVGSPVANRTRVETEGLIGFFVNTLVLRCDLAGAPTARQALARLRAATLAAYTHQDVPFEKLVEELQPERSLAVSPLFQVLFTLESPPPPPTLPGFAVTPVGAESGVAKFDLSLAFTEGEGRFTGALEFNTDLFDAPTAARLARGYLRLVDALVAAPEKPLAALPLLAAGETHQLLHEWNDQPGEPGSLEGLLPLPRLFEIQAARTPTATAVLAGSEPLTYGELDDLSNRLARRLQALGVGPEVPVGILLERTPEMLVALFATLKAGGAYVPLDPAYPEARLTATLEDCGAPVIVAHEWLLDRLAGLPAGRREIVALDGSWDFLDGEAAGPLAVDLDLANLAYLIYTSGSTGRPKGVAISHGSAVAFLRWSLATFPREELAGVLAATSICFDLSVFEIFAPLSAGGSVVLVENALDLLFSNDAQKVTLINTVPSAAAEILRARGGDFPPGVRALNLAGEPIPLPLSEQLVRGPYRARNLYGPSEATTYATGAEIVPADAAAGRPAPIGHPIAGLASYVVDGALEPRPVGAPGELVLSGPSLARGYLGRPELTAAAFVPDPFGPPGGRLYKTGDLSRHLPDGRLEFLGRIDGQVKVRGFRIELGEVETALARHPAVLEAVAAVREPAPGDRRLAAWVAARAGAAVTPAELADALRGALPEYMVPGEIAVLPALPRLPNGKVDKSALLVTTGAGRAGARAAYAEPQGDLERTIAQVMAEALAVPRVGRDDNFFDLGGHSLLMIRAASLLEGRTGKKVQVLEMFRFPTPAALAAYLHEGDAPAPDAGALAARGEERRRAREARHELRQAAQAAPVVQGGGAGGTSEEGFDPFAD